MERMASAHAAAPLTRFWEQGRGPTSPEEFAVLTTMTTVMSVRNAAEDLHAAGAFSDRQTPALNRRLRDHAYTVMLALSYSGTPARTKRSRLAEQAAHDGAVNDPIEPLAALRGAIRSAVQAFARAEHLTKIIARQLAAAAMDGATTAFQAQQTLDEPELVQTISYLAWLIPTYWELPEVDDLGLRRRLADDRSSDALSR